MDSISDILEFGFEITTTDMSTLKEPEQLLLGIVGRFSVLVGPKTLYEEVEFCLVEFAMDVSEWLIKVPTTNEDFVYESLESDEIGLVWIKSGTSGWHVGSIHQNYQETKSFNIDEIRMAINHYLHKLKRELYDKFGLVLNLQPRSISELFE